MQSEPDLNPFRPMRHLIREMVDEGSLPPFMSPIVVQYRRGLKNRNEGGLSGFIEFLKDLDASMPGPDDLDPTPELIRWCLVREKATGLCRLVGNVAGHPNFDFLEPVCSSPVFAIDPDFRWARVLSRWYLLKDYDPEAFGRMIRSLLIDRRFEMVRFGDADGL